MNLTEAKAALKSALETYASKEATATKDELRALSDEAKKARKAVSDAICSGASPCPICGASPIGLEHQTPRGGFEYQVGCVTCPVVDHPDGTKRRVSARGGTMPHHAVEAWNAGPDFWMKA